MTAIIFHEWMQWLEVKMGLTVLYLVAFGLIAVGVYLLLLTQNKVLRPIGIIALCAGSMLLAYTVGDQHGGTACEARHKDIDHQREVLVLKEQHAEAVKELEKQRDAANELTEFTAKQRDQLEKENAERSTILEGYKSRLAAVASTCRTSTADDAAIVCRITRGKAVGCPAPKGGH